MHLVALKVVDKKVKDHLLKEVLPLEHNLHQVVFGVMLQKQMNLKINQIILQNLQETIAMKIQMILHVHKCYHLQQRVE